MERDEPTPGSVLMREGGQLEQRPAPQVHNHMPVVLNDKNGKRVAVCKNN